MHSLVYAHNFPLGSNTVVWLVHIFLFLQLCFAFYSPLCNIVPALHRFPIGKHKCQLYTSDGCKIHSGSLSPKTLVPRQRQSTSKETKKSLPLICPMYCIAKVQSIISYNITLNLVREVVLHYCLYFFLQTGQLEWKSKSKQDKIRILKQVAHISCFLHWNEKTNSSRRHRMGRDQRANTCDLCHCERATELSDSLSALWH